MTTCVICHQEIGRDETAVGAAGAPDLIAHKRCAGWPWFVNVIDIDIPDELPRG